MKVQKLSVVEGHICEELKDVGTSLILGSNEKLKRENTLCELGYVRE